MKRQSLCVLMTALMLSGCYTTQYDLWPRHSGDAIPITKPMWCVSFGNGAKMDGHTFVLKPINATNEYTISDEKGAGIDHFTFHRIKPDDTLYVIADRSTDKHNDSPGEYIFFARIADDGSWMTLIDPPTNGAERIAHDMGLVVHPDSMSGTADQQKTFILRLAQLDDFSVGTYCGAEK